MFLPYYPNRNFICSGWYLLTGYSSYCVVRHSPYGEYDFMPSALYLQHPVSRYKSAGYVKYVLLTP